MVNRKRKGVRTIIMGVSDALARYNASRAPVRALQAFLIVAALVLGITLPVVLTKQNQSAINALRLAEQQTRDTLFTELMQISMNSSGVETITTPFHSGTAVLRPEPQTYWNPVSISVTYAVSKVCIAQVCMEKFEIFPFTGALSMLNLGGIGDTVTLRFTDFTQTSAAPPAPPAAFVPPVALLRSPGRALFPYADGTESNLVLAPDCRTTAACTQAPDGFERPRVRISSASPTDLVAANLDVILHVESGDFPITDFTMSGPLVFFYATPLESM